MVGNVNPPRCPHCEGRLFLEREYRGGRSFYYWECSLGCNRRFYTDLVPMSPPAPMRIERVPVKVPVLVS